MKVIPKIIVGLEKISEVFKSLLWEKAKIYNLSPIQIRILIFIATHDSNLCNISYLAKELHVTKPTISDAVKMLLKKEFLTKDFSPVDNRRYNLIPTAKMDAIFSDLKEYSLPITEELKTFNKLELDTLFNNITKLIYQLNQNGIIKVQRTCFNCRFYQGDKSNNHYCNFIKAKLKNNDLRLDCSDFEVRASIE